MAQKNKHKPTTKQKKGYREVEARVKRQWTLITSLWDNQGQEMAVTRNLGRYWLELLVRGTPVRITGWWKPIKAPVYFNLYLTESRKSCFELFSHTFCFYRTHIHHIARTQRERDFTIAPCSSDIPSYLPSFRYPFLLEPRMAPIYFILPLKLWKSPLVRSSSTLPF